MDMDGGGKQLALFRLRMALCMDKKPERIFQGMPVIFAKTSRAAAFASLTVLAALTACSNKGEIAQGGIISVRSACPDAAIPAYTGDVTLFRAPGNTDASNLDAVAEITNMRSNCSDAGSQFYTEATFEVTARRTDASQPRQITLPYFSTVVRGGSNVVAKRIGTVTLNFAAGQERASAMAKASSYVDKSVATLPSEVQDRINRKRKAGDADAALDPLADPQVKAAIQRTSFALLVGFNLTQDQLRYNVTR